MANERLEALSFLCAAYPAAPEMTPETIKVYLAGTADIPLADLKTVYGQCIASHKFLPTIAEIREVWRALSGGLGVQTAAEAWAVVLKAMRYEGHMRKPKFSNPLTEQAVASMGWRELCLSEAPAGVDRAQFMRIYEQLLARQTSLDGLTPPARTMLEMKVKQLTANVAAARRLTAPKEIEDA